MPVSDLIEEEFQDLWQPYFRRALAGEAVKFDLERGWPILGRRMVEITYVPDIAADGSVSGLFGLAQDVTERRTAKEATQQRGPASPLRPHPTGPAHRTDRQLGTRYRKPKGEMVGPELSHLRP